MLLKQITIKQTNGTTQWNNYHMSELTQVSRRPCLAVHYTVKSDDINWLDRAMRGSTGEG